jgi:DnaA family protein
VSTPQLPLGLRYAPDQRLQDYRDAPAGLLPMLEAIAVAKKTAGTRSDALFLSGPGGAGKTHLLLGLYAEATAHGHEVAYLPLRMFGARSVDALGGQGTAALVCIDDVDAIAGMRDAEVALFDLHNRVRAAGAAIVYAANATPAQLAIDLPDLRSRLAQCTQFALEIPDEPARRAILRQRAQTRGLELDDAVLDWLFRRVDRDLGTLTALLDRLDRASLAAQRRITVPFLRQTLGVE